MGLTNQEVEEGGDGKRRGEDDRENEDRGLGFESGVLTPKLKPKVNGMKSYDSGKDTDKVQSY